MSYTDPEEIQVVVKSDICKAVAQKTELPESKVIPVICAFLEIIQDQLGMNRKVELRGFGHFEPTIRAPRTGRNAKTGEPVPIPARKGVKFKMGTHMINALGELEDGE